MTRIPGFSPRVRSCVRATLATHNEHQHSLEPTNTGTGNVAQLQYDASDLTTTNGVSGLDNDGITVSTFQQGSEPIEGTFTLGFDNSENCRTQTSLCSYTYTAPIRNDASASEVKYALQELGEIGIVDVIRVTNTDGHT